MHYVTQLQQTQWCAVVKWYSTGLETEERPVRESGEVPYIMLSAGLTSAASGITEN